MSTRKPRTTWRALLLLLLLLAFSGTATQAAETRRTILVLPFQINAERHLEGLHRDVPGIIRETLEEQGHRVLSRNQTKKILADKALETPDRKAVNQLLEETEATHAVYGSLTQAGDRISLDAKLVQARFPSIHQDFSRSRRGVAQIGLTAREIGRNIAKAVASEQNVTSIEVTGNARLNAEAVLERIETEEGQPYDPERIDRDIRKLHESGYFQDIAVRVQDLPGGKEVVYDVEERPLISEVVVQGAKALDQGDILEAVSSQSGDIINPEIIAKDLEAVRELYRKDGYYNVHVGYSREKVDTGQVTLRIEIDEGEKRYIQSIRIKGAEKIASGELKDQLALSERGFFSWFTGGGVLEEKLLNRDAAALEAYYANRGFVEVKVGQPEVESVEDGLAITFRVQEGPRYKLGAISFRGDLIFPRKELLKHVRVDNMAEKDAYFDRSVLREDSEKLEELYRKHGYAFAKADPRLSKNSRARTIDIAYALNQGRRVYIDRVRVSGNTKTRDNVIRRNLDISGGDLFDSDKIARSKQKLRKLGYFESVEIDTVPSGEGEGMDLQVKVKEKSTGSFSLGAGYSSVNKLFFTGEIRERNLLGRGYDLSFRGSFSSRQTHYQLSFWNPRLYDSSLGVGFDAYNSQREYNDYDLDRTGGKTKFAYSIGDHTRLYWNYNLEEYTVNNIDASASDQIQDIAGTNWSSAVNVSAVRDTTDRRLYPTRGTKNILSVEYSGGPLGGDDNFIKPGYELSYYHPLIADFVFSWHGKYSQLFENTSEPVPDFERFYLGGINTVRGYDYQDISSEDESGDEIGGYKQFYTNTEITYPLIKNMGLYVLGFFDAGNVWNKNESVDGDLYKSVGGGIRWNSPMGPLRLEYGYPLDKVDGEMPGGRFEFSVGQAF